MKKHLLIFCAILISPISNAQIHLPTLGAMTVIPQSPKAGDFIKIVTYVETPNQGIVVDLSHTVTSNPNEIRLTGCYWHGMLAAIDEYVDTFMVGQLPAGSYVIKHKAHMSSTQQHCSKVDSNSAQINLTVSSITGFGELIGSPEIFVFPNPATQLLHISNDHDFSTASIYAYDGLLIHVEQKEPVSELNIKDLPPGMYFIRFSGPQTSAHTRFVKIAGE